MSLSILSNTKLQLYYISSSFYQEKVKLVAWTLKHILRAPAVGSPTPPANGAWRARSKNCLPTDSDSFPPNPSLQTAEGRHWVPSLSKFWTFAGRSFPPSKLLGLANTRISTAYAQKSPRFGLAGAFTGSHDWAALPSWPSRVPQWPHQCPLPGDNCKCPYC